MGRKKSYDSYLNHRYVLGMDVSQRNCGLYLFPLSGLISNCKFASYDLGGFNLKDESRNSFNEQCLYRLKSRIVSFAAEYHVVLAVIEEHAFSRLHRIAWGAERVGVAKVTAAFELGNNIPVIDVAPTSRQKYITTIANSKKDKDVVQRNLTNLGYPYSTEHDADAAVLAMIGTFCIRPNKFLPPRSVEVVESVKEKNKKKLQQVILKPDCSLWPTDL